MININNQTQQVWDWGQPAGVLSHYICKCPLCYDWLYMTVNSTVDEYWGHSYHHEVSWVSSSLSDYCLSLHTSWVCCFYGENEKVKVWAVSCLQPECWYKLGQVRRWCQWWVSSSPPPQYSHSHNLQPFSQLILEYFSQVFLCQEKMWPLSEGPGMSSQFYRRVY